MPILKKEQPTAFQEPPKEVPPLAREIIERSKIAGHTELPQELPRIAELVESPKQEYPIPQESAHASDDIKEVKERLERIESLLRTAVPGKYLILRDGKVLKNIADLRSALATMSSETFNLHVNFERNDFANWVRNVFLEKELADKLDGATSRAQMIRILNEYFD
ncbi:MAG: hypothetical protein QXW00_04135 [Candidatus Woesearchaeota archaeon]